MRIRPWSDSQGVSLRPPRVPPVSDQWSAFSRVLKTPRDQNHEKTAIFLIKSIKNMRRAHQLPKGTAPRESTFSEIHLNEINVCENQPQ